MSTKPFTLAELIYSAWACGVTFDQVLAEAIHFGFTTCKAEIEAAWADHDEQLAIDLGQQFHASVVGSDDFTNVPVKRTCDDDGKPLNVMAILTPTMEVHITCGQAMKFFGLVKATV